MLGHSIGTFRHYFGAAPEYVVYADAPGFVAACLEVEATVRDMAAPGGEYLDPRATWMKWAPRFRHDPGSIEMRVDSDFFLVDEPVELREFVAGDGHDYVVTMEESTQPRLYGNFGARLPPGFAPINAGFFGQRSAADLSEPMRIAYRWWADQTRDDDVRYHDEQGALAYVLQSLIGNGQVLLLDPARYRVVCPSNDPPVENLDGIVGLHATYPDHPAYHRFRVEISQISGIPSRAP
jgi:hypothetical protein